MILGNQQRRRRGLFGLGVTSAVVNGSMIYGNPPVRDVGLARPVVPTNGGGVVGRPIVNPPGGPISPAWGTGSGLVSTGGYAYGAGTGYQPAPSDQASSSQTNLAQLTLLYQANPASLTASQWQQLQAAGVIPSTVPYGDSSLITGTTSASSSSAIDPATGVPYATELAEAEAGSSTSSIGTTLSTDYAGVPLYAWLGGAVVLYLLMSGKRR